MYGTFIQQAKEKTLLCCACVTGIGLVACTLFIIFGIAIGYDIGMLVIAAKYNNVTCDQNYSGHKLAEWLTVASVGDIVIIVVFMPIGLLSHFFAARITGGTQEADTMIAISYVIKYLVVSIWYIFKFVITNIGITTLQHIYLECITQSPELSTAVLVTVLLNATLVYGGCICCCAFKQYS